MSDPLGLISGQVGGAIPQPPKMPKGVGQSEGPDFKDVLMENINQVNRLQQDAEMAIADLASGERTDVDGVLMAKQKADMAFNMLLQVRNKLVDAFSVFAPCLAVHTSGSFSCVKNYCAACGCF